MHLPANTFSARHESRGENLAASTGTAHTPGNGSKSSWANLGGTTSFAYEALTVCLLRNDAVDYMIDIGVSDGSNRYVLIENLRWAAAKQIDEHNLHITIPVHVASGAQLSVRGQGNGANPEHDVMVIGHSANPGGFPGYSRAIALFTSPGSSRGVNVDPGGSVNTKGSWAELTSSCPADVAAIFGVVGFNGDLARGANVRMLLDIGVGAGGSEFVLVPDLFLSWSSTWDGPNDVFFQPLAAQIPAGTRIAARAQCGTTSDGDRDIDFALYGLVA